MTRSRRLVPRPPSDASRRLLKARHSKPACVFDRISADRRWTGIPSGPEGERYPLPSGGIAHLFDPRGRRCPPAKTAHCLAAFATKPQNQASVLRRRLIYRERLAPTGNRAIPSSRPAQIWCGQLFVILPVIQARPGRYRLPSAGCTAALALVGTLDVMHGPLRSYYTHNAALSRTIREQGTRRGAALNAPLCRRGFANWDTKRPPPQTLHRRLNHGTVQPPREQWDQRSQNSNNDRRYRYGAEY